MSSREIELAIEKRRLVVFVMHEFMRSQSVSEHDVRTVMPIDQSEEFVPYTYNLRSLSRCVDSILELFDIDVPASKLSE